MRKVFYVLGILNDADVEWMAARGRPMYLPSGTTLIEEGVQVDSVYIVLDGKLSITTRRADGGEIASLGSGEIIGEISFVDSRPPTASVRTVTESYVLALPREQLNKKLEHDPGFASRFYHAIATFLADRLRSTVGQLGYEARRGSTEGDELDDTWMENISYGATRFDRLLRKLKAGRSAA